MQRIALWKQLLTCGALVGVAAVGWHSREDIGALWASVATGPEAATARRAPAQGTPVIVAQTAMVQDDLTFSAIGTGFAQRSVTLRAPSSGEIVDLNLAPGARFAAGDTLMRLEDTDERLAVELAEARLERATSERDRYRQLQGTGSAATARLEDAETAFKVARITLEQARADLADRGLRAPFDGVTGLASVETGDRVATDDPIANFDDRSRILVEVDLPEALLGRVSEGDAVLASTPSAEDRTFTGEITAIDSRVNAVTRTARVRAAIDNAGDALRPGASFALRLDLPGRSYPAVPELALQFARGALHVWRVEDGAVRQVEVRLKRRREGLVIVDGPLSSGDAVVVEGMQRLRPGTAVEVLNTTGEPST